MTDIYLRFLFGKGVEGEQKERQAAVRSFPFVIGRRRDSDLCIPDGCVSRQHCRLFLRRGRLWMEDLGSLNGSFVNEEPLRGPRSIHNGDVLRLGYVSFKALVPPWADEASIDKTQVVEARPAGGGRQVLVVEDDVNAAQSLALLLKAWGHEVRVAHDGPEALRSARDHPPDAVLLDVRLPGMGGYEVAQRLRTEAGLEHAQVVAMTGCPDAVEGIYSEDTGIQQLLIKPVSTDALKHVIDGFGRREEEG